MGTQRTRILQICADFLGCFILGLHLDTLRYEWMYGFYGFHRWVRIFLFFCWDFEQEFQKNPYPSVKSVKSVHPFVSQCIQV
jgi:hypothetical protein